MREAITLAVTTAKPSGALAVGPTELLGVGDGPSAVAYGHVGSWPYPTPNAPALLESKEERLAGPPTGIPRV